MNPSNNENSRGVLQSVQKGLKILRLFSNEKPEWGISEMACALHIHKSTVSRLVSELVTKGFLEKKGRKYRLGLSLLRLSGVVTSHLEIHRESKEILHQLVDDLEETAHVAILEDGSVTYLHKVECKHPVRLLSHVGKRNPAHCTSSGKILLAYQPESKVKDWIAGNGLMQMGPNSITDPDRLLHDLRNVKKQGYSVCIDEMHEDVVSIAAPIRDYTGQVVAAVSVVGPGQRITQKKIPAFIKRIIEAGKTISINMGYIESVYQKGEPLS